MQGPILEAKERNGLSRRPIRERLFHLPVLQTVINGHNRGANRAMEAQEKELLILALEEAWSSKILREKICMGIQELGGSYGERGSPAPSRRPGRETRQPSDSGPRGLSPRLIAPAGSSPVRGSHRARSSLLRPLTWGRGSSDGFGAENSRTLVSRREQAPTGAGGGPKPRGSG